MRILVTGAAGFVGKNLVENLKNIRDGKNRTRPAISIEEIYEYDMDSTQEELDEFDDQDNWIDHHIWSGFRKKDELEKKGQNWWKRE